MFQVGRVAVSPIGRISPESFDPRRNSAFELICQLERERERELYFPVNRVGGVLHLYTYSNRSFELKEEKGEWINLIDKIIERTLIFRIHTTDNRGLICKLESP